MIFNIYFSLELTRILDANELELFFIEIRINRVLNS